MRRTAALTIAVLVLAGCASTDPDDGRVQVVASTDVYGSIAAAIGGDHVSVVSLVEGAARDPHSFEASARDRLALSKADLVIENGGGYDPFMEQLVDAVPRETPMITATKVVGLADGANEHLWYDFDAMALVATEIAAQLSGADQPHADDYSANLRTLLDGIEALEPGDIGAGRRVLVTEPVPLYLLERAGFENVTPEAFTEAIEEGGDVAPAVLRDTLELVNEASLLAYNSQTASPETERLREAAWAAGIPVVEFTETLPAGETYLSWMRANVAALVAL
jgi:zinc/manganese transport system substrate-binding protein